MPDSAEKQKEGNMSNWNPEHWKQYSDAENREFRDQLKHTVDKHVIAEEDKEKYKQWIREIGTLLDPSDQSK